MKTNLTTFFIVLFMIFSFHKTYASYVSNPLKEKDAKSIMITYVNAITLGMDEYNKYLFADDFEYKNSVNNDSFNKKEYLKFLNSSKGLKFNCRSEYKILDQTGNSCIAKAMLKFDNFTRIDIITLQLTNDGWKISKVITNYEK